MSHPRLVSIEQEWQGLWNNIKADHQVGSVYYVEMRRAFYAGFHALQCQMLAISTPQVSEREGCRQLSKLQYEMTEFRNQLIKEVGQFHADRN